jgi:hypothetical protein
MTPARANAQRLLRSAELSLIHHEMTYGAESDGGANPLHAGAHLRIAAKDYYNKQRALTAIIVEECEHRTVTT